MKLALLVLIPLLAIAAVGATCGNDEDGAPAPTSTPGRKIVDAPIDGLDIVVRESFPPQYGVHIVSGLPSGCAQFDKAEITGRTAAEITIRVTNTVPADPNVACTAIYGTHESDVDLGSDFTAGATYTVRVNDKSIDFTAQ
ncbi:MAG TPA: hypothetical protein VJP07_01605 [Dehalococcoidia bacterium]|nr:hypothetical protein [Dehalococcoidia bacterium]